MEAMRECAAPVSESVEVWRSYLWIVKGMYRPEGQVIGDKEQKVRMFRGCRL
jgi:hypothetical protein